MSIFLLSLTVMMLLVIYFDLTSFTIPNWLNGTLICLYVVLLLVTPEVINWQMALAGAGIVFALGFVVFGMNWMGGGDIKLLIALALWVGWSNLLEYVLIVAILGGLLAVVIWLMRKALPWILPKSNMNNYPRILKDDEPVPYGLAIAGGFLYYLWIGNITGVVA